MQNRMDRVMHVHVHGVVGEFSKTGAKSRASVIDSAKIMLFPAKDHVKMPRKRSKMLAVLVPRRNAVWHENAKKSQNSNKIFLRTQNR